MSMFFKGSPAFGCLAVYMVLGFAASAGEPLDFTYTISRAGVEKTPGSLNDGKTGTGISWATKFKSETDIILELTETCEIERIEVSAHKWTKWYILDELRISTDDGSGGFGDPTIVAGMPRTTESKELRDASCTNYVFSAANLGKAVRVKVDVRSDATVSISEIRLFGKRAAAKAAVRTAAKPSDKPIANGHPMENAQWRIVFSPLGGRVARLHSKAIGATLTGAAGSFLEEVWDRKSSHKFLECKPYQMHYETAKGGVLEATAVGNAQGGGIDFLKVEKRYAASDDSTSLRVNYKFTNIPEAMALQNYAPLIHTMLGVFGQQMTYFYPGEEGIVAVPPAGRHNEYWCHRPSRGWMAAATEDGVGVAITMPFADVKAFYSWYPSDVPTMEWRMTSVALKEGESYDVATEVIPFKGLPVVSGAGGGLVGMLKDGVCRVVSARAGEVTAEADGQTERLAFAKPGDAAEFRTAAKTVSLKRGGAEVCRLDAPPEKGDWTLAKAGPQRASSVAEADLTYYTNFPKHVCTAWGKPLPGRRLRVAAVTGSGNLPELGRLAERFDMELRTIGTSVGIDKNDKRHLGSPIFSNGDHFSLVNVGDVERGIAKVLAWDADVILFGGVPFEALNKDLRAQLLAKVKGGTGLVWIGQDRNVPELGFALQEKKTAKAVPEAVGDAFASVPFSLIGDEPAYAIDPQGGVVHAQAKGRPYLVETKLGEGRVFNIGYAALASWRPAAGITPMGLRDFYETRTAPVEHCYSLIAKALLAAAGRTLPVRFGKSEVTAKACRFDVTADVPGHTRWEWCAVDPFGRTLAHGERKVELRKGEQTVTLDGLAIPPTDGKLALEVIVRARNGGVLNWGAWAFACPPPARISGLKLDAPWHDASESVTVEAEVAGVAEGLTLEVKLVDSYGRTLGEEKVKGEVQEVKGQTEDDNHHCLTSNLRPLTSSSFTHRSTFSFALANALPSRTYTVEARLVTAAGVECSRRRAELRVRPASATYAWDDFEIGTWANNGNREYLWPELAEIYRDIGISTLIANPERMQTVFPRRYNFNPTLLSSAGLGRSAEPKAYSETGDKMKLVRGTCLSSPKFFASRDKSLKGTAQELREHAFRFVWFGDEQSITSYGGTAIDFCFSPDCLRELRTFLKGRYADLAALNATWETDFASWDDVVPFTRQEVWEQGGRHVAGWSDHLEFMDSRLTNSLAYSVRPLKLASPETYFAISGTQQPSAYGGMDWWKQLGVLDAALNYGSGGQFDIHRSFRPDGGFMPWNWGYSNRGGVAVDRAWCAVFVGSRGLMGFQSSSQINNDFSYSMGLRDTADHVRRMAGAMGRHFVANLRPPHDVAILYSQASYRAAFIENRRKEHDEAEEEVRQALMNLGVSYDYLSYEQLERGEAVRRNYRVLVLADACAMSDAEIAGVRAFAAKGGTVVAVGMPAMHRTNCTKRSAPPLADLFGKGGQVLFEQPCLDYLKAVEYPDKAENAPIVAAERARWQKALARAGVVQAGIALTDAESGRTVVNAKIWPKADAAGNRTWCILASKSAKVRETRIAFPKAGYVYDLVSGRAYGNVRELKLPFGVGTPYAFAQYDKPVELARPLANGAAVTLAYSTPVDGAVRVRVYRPDGTEAACYARNVTMKGGKGAYEIPFCLSDPHGEWKVSVENVFGRQMVEESLKVIERVGSW